MKKGILIKKSNLKYLPSIGIMLLIGFCLFFLWDGLSNSSQSEPPSVAGVAFQGEYRIGDGEWSEIKEGEHIPSTKGDVTLRGYFIMLNPTNGEPISKVNPGISISFYFNHIRAEIPIEGVGKIKFDAENELIGEDACAIMRGSFTISNVDEPTTIVIRNPHKYGNDLAIDQLLGNLRLDAPTMLGETLSKDFDVYRYVGFSFAAIAIFLHSSAVGAIGFSRRTS
jgi:hypothetical protein